jgi:hypothetical protein
VRLPCRQATAAQLAEAAPRWWGLAAGVHVALMARPACAHAHSDLLLAASLWAQHWTTAEPGPLQQGPSCWGQLALGPLVRLKALQAATVQRRERQRQQPAEQQAQRDAPRAPLPAGSICSAVPSLAPACGQVV